MTTTTAVLNQRVAIDETNATYKDILSDLQCNILSGHGRSHTHYFFLRFGSLEAQKVKSLLRDLAAGKAFGERRDSGLESELSSRARRLQGREPWADSFLANGAKDYSCNILLTAACYNSFLRRLTIPSDGAFKAGLENRDQNLSAALKLNDHLPHTRRPFEALYMVSYNPEEVDWPSDRTLIGRYLAERVEQVAEVEGYVLRHPQRGYPIEPFGYRDAVSQPLFYVKDLESRRGFEGSAATQTGVRWSSLAPLSLALVHDPNGSYDYSFGTYVAYRKFRQDVYGFYAQAEALAAATSAPSLSRDEIADRLIGRRVDGHPLDPSDNYNDFSYSEQSICPRHAHARKMNPRNGDVGNHRIIRRATVFGPRLRRRPDGRPVLRDERVVHATGRPDVKEPSAKQSDDVGLMFFCCQANIAEQFEFIQGRWANDPNGGADTVIGQMPLSRPEKNKIGLNQSGLKYAYKPVVQLLEGEYFFAPSLSFFTTL